MFIAATVYIAENLRINSKDKNTHSFFLAQEKNVSVQDSYRDIQMPKKTLEEHEKEYRKIYNLPVTKELFFDEYYTSGVISSTNIVTTKHESRIALCIIGERFFDRRCVFMDSYFKSRTGRYVQVDLIAVNSKGVFVFESKDYNGWIYGNGEQLNWTQVYYKDKFRFYNPIKQNYSHVQCIKEKIENDKIPFYSIIVFGDDAELKNISYVPKNTYVCTSRRIGDLMTDIMDKGKNCLTGVEIIDVCRKINNSKIEPTDEIRKEHVEIIKDRTGESRIYG